MSAWCAAFIAATVAGVEGVVALLHEFKKVSGSAGVG
jgi:hypothetical protein